MTFWLKKVVSQLIMPIPLTLLLLMMALVFWRRAGKKLVCAAMLLLGALSSNGVSNWLTGMLEQEYQVNNAPISDGCVVMVLGSAMDDSIEGKAIHQLSSVGLARLSEGLRQLSLGSDCMLITSGWSGELNRNSYARVAADAAVELGVDPARIIQLPLAKDTIEEAQYLKMELGDVPFRLVTSAAHMPRAIKIFEHAGMHPQAAPADFRRRSSHWWVLSADNLLTSQRAIHEWAGQLWFNLKYDDGQAKHDD
ncbi:YdcF family protein [Shewanella submarina]|uniref:YdcF family protein n=1 Tax=Shewanella submarina TaxID=2016376 RepID=A0ABV7GHQ8_9GAMM|nr:ElyC/SanA/YdcF family protein [Shewanella submarina]MCL1036553.1 YdcF family protein [Shewanella submarina]